MSEGCVVLSSKLECVLAIFIAPGGKDAVHSKNM
jgi:hypothetical protein